MSRRTDVDGLADAVIQELAQYNQRVTDEMKAAIRKTANECRQDVRQRSPRQTGKYAEGWVATVELEKKSDIRVTVRNRTHYQLTHLLENGHAKATGGRVDGVPHIRPAEEAAIERLIGRIRDIAGEG